MTFLPEVDLTSTSSLRRDEAETRMHRKLFSGTLFSVLILGLILVWIRSPIYHSTALLQLTFPDGRGNGQITARTFSISEYKLTSQTLIDELKTRLIDDGIHLDGEVLASMLRTEGDPEQGLISLFAEGDNPDELSAVMTHWMELYVSENEQALSAQTSREQEDLLGKIEELSQRISTKRTELERFSEQYDVSAIQQDENRILSKIKTIINALNRAEEEQIQAESLLYSLQQARLSGQPIADPGSKAQIQRINSQLLTIEQELENLSELFTPEYMALDPAIVKKQRRLNQLREELSSLRDNSAKLYEDQVSQQLAQARGQVARLNEQRKTLRAEANAANERWEQFQGMTDELDYLQDQAQQLQAQLLDHEVIQTQVARVDVLEGPSMPQYPVGPYYWRDTGLVALVATLLALLVTGLMKWLSTSRSSPLSTTYTVIQNPAAANPAIPHVPPQALPHQQTLQQLGYQQTPQAHLPSTLPQLRLLSESEIIALLKSVSEDASRAVKLVLSGVSPHELLSITLGDIEVDEQLIHLQGRFQRSLKLPKGVIQSISGLNLAEADSLWLAPDGQVLVEEDLNALLSLAAEDANLSAPHEVTLDAIRHTYLCFLAAQGCKLSSLESIAGYVAPRQLSFYRGLSQGQGESIETIHPRAT